MKSSLQQFFPRCGAEPVIFTGNTFSTARFQTPEKMVLNELSEQPLPAAVGVA